MIDPRGEYAFTSLLPSISQGTNNAASGGFDMRGYIGRLAVRVNLGVKTVGDANGVVTVILQASADNTAANAVTLAAGAGLVGAVNVSTSNNAAASNTLSVDIRALPAGARYLFSRTILAGGNTPTYPVAVEVIGKKQVT